MATAHEESAGRSLEGLSSRQGCDSGEALTEWRSCEQVENGTPSTSPPYWDTDDSDDDGGLKPCDLYGKYTWKIEKFSTINKRELKSSVFEVGGYRWYILIYPQGCDVCNHLSLFLCVANHDKLLPGWSHFAQFTIAVVNKDPKKSKYSDTLHRFWKKEHDWGWKKFMELSKVSDGFLDADTLIIKAQVQVVRERSNRPFRCLDCQYRRELVRVYLTNVEQICRRFVDDRRGKLETLLEDKARWSSFCAFWLEIDQSARRLMSSEKMDSILKMIVKHFFIEKDVTSTLVIDSLYSGFKALKGQSKCIIGKAKVLEGVDMPPPVVQVEEEMFVLVDDVLLLLERATMEPLPPKDEKGPQNRTKDGGAGEDFSKDSIERDERRLTELGRRTVEIFVLTHIFSKIEAAYQEAIALKRQEELIREEKAETEQRAKREMAGKEKRLLKKKQSKQKRNNRKAKDKLKDEKPGLMSEDNHIHRIPAEEVKDSLGGPTILDKDETLEDVSDVSDSVEYSADILQPDSEDRDSSPVNWDTDISEVLPPEASSSAVGGDISSLHLEGDMRSSSVMDDSSSTCSTDSAPSLVTNVSYRGNSSKKNKSQKSPTRGKNQRASVTYEEANGSKEANRLTSKPVKDLRHQQHTFADKVAVSSEYEAADSSLEETMKQPEQLIVKKEEEVIVLQKKQSNINQVASDRQKKEKASAASYLPQSPPKRMISTFHPKSEPKDIPVDVIPASKIGANSMQYTNKAASSVNVPQASSTAKLGSITAPLPKPTEKRSGQQATFLISRPLSTPLIHGSKPAVTPIVPMAQTVPVLSRSMSATGRLGPDPSSAKRSYSALSYKSAILGNVAVSPSSFSQPPPSPSSAVNMSPSPVPSPSPSLSFSKSSTLVPGPIYIPQATERVMLKSVNPGISYSAAAREAVLHSGRHQWLDSPRREAPNRSIPFDPPSMLDEIQNLELNNSPIHTRSHDVLQSNFSISTSGRQATQVADEFPHLDIINDLLDDEQGFGSGLTLPDQRFSLPTDLSVPVGLGSSPGSCRVEQMYYEDFFQPEYGLPGNDYDTLPEYIPYNNMPYMNGQIDGSVHNQWPVAGYDHLSMLNMGNAGTGDWYAYGVPEYSDLACGLNGYTMFRPSNGQ